LHLAIDCSTHNTVLDHYFPYNFVYQAAVYLAQQSHCFGKQDYQLERITPK